MKTFRHTLVPLGIICHYLFSRSALDVSLITWLASWALPKSSFQLSLFSLPDVFLPPHRKTIFLSVESELKGNFPITHPSSLLFSGASAETAGCTSWYTGEPGHPQGMSRPLCPVRTPLPLVLQTS